MLRMQSNSSFNNRFLLIKILAKEDLEVVKVEVKANRNQLEDKLVVFRDKEEVKVIILNKLIKMLDNQF